MKTSKKIKLPFTLGGTATNEELVKLANEGNLPTMLWMIIKNQEAIWDKLNEDKVYDLTR